MALSRFRIGAVFTASVALALAITGPASGQEAAEPSLAEPSLEARGDFAPYASVPGPAEVQSSSAQGARSAFSPDDQHGGSEAHLPATQENIELVGKLETTAPFGDVVPGQIADVAVYKDFAYLNSWNEPTCSRGGTFVADISDPANPRQATFIPALEGNYHGEGAHVITMDTASFQGDVLAVNNEHCADTPVGGGFDLYDVTDPNNPQPLALGAGDRGPDDGSMVGDPRLPANDYHSVFLWQDGARAFAVGVDNFEFHDVDIFEITNPRAPVPVGEFDLIEEFPEIASELANGELIFHHDMVVKEIDGVQTMLSSYWDAGYVALNVEDPANPQLLRDSDFDAPDMLTGFDPPEGNAHQAEFSPDNSLVIAADEDFSPFRVETFEVDGVGEFEGTEVGGGASPASLPDQRLNGPVVYGGYGCPDSAPVPERADYNFALSTGEEAILILQRGPSGDVDEDYNGNGELTDDACFPGDKAAAAAAAGWDAVVLVNRHLGDAASDAATCGSGGYPDGLVFVTVCTTHEALHRIFDDAPQFGVPYDDDQEGPAIGDEGAHEVSATAVFDGWGYAHVYENSGTKMRELGAVAVEEALDPRYAIGFGDLSIHEVAVDPTENLAYSSYYAAGLRVFAFDSAGIRETGAFIDEGGNNFWGIEQFTDDEGFRLMAASDRDFGLYIARYTGPGAVVPQSPGQGPGAPGGPGPSEGPSAAVPEADCQGRTVAKRSGTDGDDDLVGTVGPDAIFGGAGDDTENGLDGPDCLLGEDGDDTLKGGGGEELARGGDGDDKLRGNGGRDKLQGDAGVDNLGGGEGSDRITGGPGDDKLTGGPGKDRIRGSGSNDEINSVDAKRDRVKCGSGDDRATVDPIDQVSRNCDAVIVVDHG